MYHYVDKRFMCYNTIWCARFVVWTMVVFIDALQKCGLIPTCPTNSRDKDTSISAQSYKLVLFSLGANGNHVTAG